MSEKYKLVPVEPTREMWAAAGDAVVALNSHHHDAISEAVYKAMLAAAPAVQEEPAIRKLGIMGAAFAPPSVRRAYTYSDQPNNTTAWKLGRAACKERSGGDFIDYGLQMLQYLQEEGFGVFEIDEADPVPQPATDAALVEPVTFCEDAALSIAERTFNTEVDEQLASDIIQYAQRLHSLYAAPQSAPDVTALLDSLTPQVIDWMRCGLAVNGHLQDGDHPALAKLRAAIDACRKQGGE